MAEDWKTMKSAWQYAPFPLSHVMVPIWTRVVPAPLHPCLTTNHFTMVLMPFLQRWENGVVTTTTTTMLSIVHNNFIWKYGFMLFVYMNRESPYRQIDPFKVRSTVAQYTIDCPSRFALGYLHTRLGITLVTLYYFTFHFRVKWQIECQICNMHLGFCTRTWMNVMTICEYSYIILVLLLSQPVHHLWY